MVVLPPFSCVDSVGQVSAVAVDTVDLTGGYTAWASSPTPRRNRDWGFFLGGGGVDGRTTLTDILHKYSHVFPAPGDSVTGRTQWSVTKSRLTVLGPSAVGHVALRRQGFGQNRSCQGHVRRGQIEPSDSPWASRVVLVTKAVVTSYGHEHS